MVRRPAYSAPFTPDALQDVPSIDRIDDITAEWAWAGSTGHGVKVAVIDSGIESSHPAVGGNVAGYIAIQEGEHGLVFDTEPHEDVFGHGTACAGIIRAVAPECALYSVQVLGPKLSGRGSVFAAGLRWAIDQGMDVCNLSLGTTKRDFYAMFHELADAACFRNVMLVTAANNLPMPSFPSVYASVISVASHSEQDPYLIYYNPQPPVEFGAPGIDVRVAWKDRGYVTSTGNSYAAPHVAGLVAKILGKHPGLTVFQMKVILRALAANVAPTQRDRIPEAAQPEPIAE